MSPELDSRREPWQDEADAWYAWAPELADWAGEVLVNRMDIHGGQYVDRDTGEIRRTTRRVGPGRDVLLGHFAAESTEEVIGLHATAPDETCRWVGIDIDLHEGRGGRAEDNLQFACELLDRAHEAGLDARLVDSSGGKGGYHLWVAFDGPIPMADARRLVLWLVRDWAEHGLPRRPDLFPGNDKLVGKKCGNWLRLPGRHHKRPSWAAAWSPERMSWLTADEAVASLLTLRGKPVDVAAIVPADFLARPAKEPARPRRGRPGGIVSAGGGERSTTPAAVEPGRRASPGPKRHRRAGDGARELLRARTALESYANEDLDYDDWLAVGMALRDLEDEGAAFALWDAWSARSVKYDARQAAAKWASLLPAGECGGIGLGTLLKRARAAGWVDPAPEVVGGGSGRRRAARRSGLGGTIVIPVRPVRGEPAGPQDRGGRGPG